MSSSPNPVTSDPWAVVSHTPIQGGTGVNSSTPGGDPWAVVSHTPIQPPASDPATLLLGKRLYQRAVGQDLDKAAQGTSINQAIAEKAAQIHERVAGREEAGQHLAALTGQTPSLLEHAQNVVSGMGADLMSSLATPKNEALAATALVAPVTRLPILAYNAAEGAYHALRPGANVPERLGGAGQAILGGVGTAVAAPGFAGNVRNLRLPVKPAARVEALGSLIDSRGGAVDPHAIASDVSPVIRQQLAKDQVDIHALKGRAAGQAVVKSVNNAIQAHSNEVALLSRPYANALVDQSPIADAYRGKITPELRANEPEVAARLEDEARKFDQPAKLSQVNELRVRLNRETSAAQGKPLGGLRKSDLETQADMAAVQAARQVQYDNLARLSNTPVERIRQLQRTEGQLLETRDSIAKELNRASAEHTEAVSRTMREKLTGAHPSQHGLVRAAVKETLGPKPLDVFNNRLKTAFGDVGPAPTPGQITPPSQPSSQPPSGPSSSGSPTLKPSTPPASPPSRPFVERRATPRPTMEPSYFDTRFAELRSALKQTTDVTEREQIGRAIEDLKRQKAGTLAQPTPSTQPTAAQGGHAGGGVSSIEELNRPGKNYIVSRNGQISYHGASFAPESTPAGATHVTVLPSGEFRVNAGQTLTSTQELALRKALPTRQAQQLTMPQPPPTAAPRGRPLPPASAASRQAVIDGIMASLKRGEITPAEADMRIQRLTGGGGRKLVRMPTPP